MNEFDRMMAEWLKLCDQYPAVLPLALVLIVIIGIVNQRWQVGKRAAPRLAGGLLSQVLFWWTPRDPLLIRDLLRSVATFGAAGSGKSSGSGYQLAKAIVANRRIGGLILASKPEDRQFWEGIFAKAGRKDDLLVFGPESGLRCNFLDWMQQTGADTREITDAIMTLGEIIQERQMEGGEEFWREQKQRTIYNAVEIVRQATGRITAPNAHKFLTGAAQTPEELKSEKWQKGLHNQFLEAAYNKKKTAIEQHDYDLAVDFWQLEYPAMSAKTRSGIVASIMGTLHVWNAGMVRELMSTTTNVSPAAVDEGKWILIDMPIGSYGPSGAFCIAAWKYLMQRHILKRHATEDTPVCVIWADEAHRIVNSKDTPFLAECRSHRGCMVYLTQSIHSYYARLGGKSGEHEADALLTNFYHKIFHAVGDDKTAAFASSLVGRRLTTYTGGSSSLADNVLDELSGKQNRFSSSYSQHMENVLENRAFLQGLRTGGPEHGMVVDGYVIRGERFSNGENFLKVAFSQEG